MAPRRVVSKARLRAVAWASAAAALVGSWGVLGWLPKPEPSVALERARPRTVVVVKKQIIRRVIVEEQAAPVAGPGSVTYVQAPSTSSSSTSAPPAPTSTGGS